ncbi:type I polyketide synthase [Micromonospora sp. NPDC049044]|uniref:type I polyketide synthase n=1 Tax=Micromonospora sp. NPDC049044 TaxID=3154827 RepID=UPI0033E01232
MSAAEDVSTTNGRRIAIVGMAGRFPGADDIDEFWTNLVNGVESLTEISEDQLRAAGVSDSVIANPNYVRLAPLLDDIATFDARYFGYHTREAQVADPQQRVFLEVCHTALQHAGYDPARHPSIGVFGGGAPNTYSNEYVYEDPSVRATVGDLTIEINNASDYIATRVAYALGLTGPAVSVTTACSTALVAVHMACKALADDECAMAVAGGVNIRVPNQRGHMWAENSIYSRDGHIRAFDADASGTNFGHGAGVLVLKRYEEAVADGDTVYATIIGSAINNDGARRASFSAPGVDGQTAVVRRALHAANVPPDSIGYIEAHGTGTALGDPIEVAALSAAYRQAGAVGAQQIPIGSVKTNIGHLGAAAGAPALIKTVLAMQHGKLPATLHYQRPNPQINFAETPFHVVRKQRSWPRVDGPKRAGVSSFGIGGTNAHVILEEAEALPPTDEGRTWQVLPLSAKTPAALTTMGAELAGYLKDHPEKSLADVAYTLQVGRPELGHRAATVCSDVDSAVVGLAVGESSTVKPKQPTPVAFLFPGQGAQFVDMAEEAYRTERVVRDTIDECAELLVPHLGLDLRDVLFSARAAGAEQELAERLRQTSITQPALFVIEYALARLWMSWGVEPVAMVGHSIGEYVAACLAGVFPLPVALELVATRGRLIQSMPAGAMLALPLAERDIEPVLTDEISLAAVNAPQATVVGGPTEAIAALHDLLTRTGVQGTMLRTSHAFHSAMLDPIVGQMRAAAADAGLQPPTRRFISTLTGTWITDEQATDPGYWADHLRQPVRFAQACQTAAETGAVLLEVGPGRSLTQLARQTVAKSTATIPSLGRVGGNQPDGQSLAQALGQLWAAGATIDWAALHAGERRRRVALPTYPYERTRYWIDSVDRTLDKAEQVEAEPPAEGEDITIVPAWRQARLASQPARSPGGPWLVFTTGSGIVEKVADRLATRGETVVRVVAGDGFADLGDGRFQIRVAHRGDYDELCAAMEVGGGRPASVLHGWTAHAATGAALDQSEVDLVRDAGYYSLLYLSQAMVTRWPGHEVRLRIATTGSADVSGTERIEPAKALLLGPTRVIPIETNELACQLIDLSATTGVETLLEEVTAPVADRVVAYRGDRRWIAGFEPAKLPEEPVAVPYLLRRRGVYLVTGGLGDIGLRVAQELARTVSARLVLTARTRLPQRDTWDDYLAEHGADKISAAIRGVRELEALGGEVLTVAADVRDEAAMRVAVDAARDRFGRIDGVFHAAGVAGGGLSSMRSREQSDAVLSPKVDGTLILDRLLGDEVDLFVLFSSIIAVTGGYGQIDYCAGNAFMDAYAQARAGGRMHTLTVNWCGWEGIGMLAEELKDTPAGPPEPAVRLGEVVHPLLGRRVLDTTDVIYSNAIGPDFHWVLTDHQMSGRSVFPGTSYVEMIVAACRASTGADSVEVRDVIFGQPIPIDGPRELRVSGTPLGSGGYQFTVSSRRSEAGAQWERHADASAAPIDAGEPARVDVPAIIDRCDVLRWKPDLDGPDNVVVFGPRWQGVEDVRLGTQEQIARLELPADVDDDTSAYQLHPALLDGATACSLYVPEAVGGESSILPIAYDRIVVRGQLPPRFHSHVRNRRSAAATSGILSYDVSLIDDDGRELVSIEGFSVRLIDIEAVHTGLDTGEATPARPSLGREELLIEPAHALDLLWRMLDSRTEHQYVVTVESIPAKTKRLAGIAARLAAMISAAGSGRIANAAARVVPANRPDSPPQTPTQEALLPLWEDAFAVSNLGLDEDFFDLGGNSLVAVQLAVRIRERFGVNVPGVAVLEYSTVRALADFIDSEAAAGRS